MKLASMVVFHLPKGQSQSHFLPAGECELEAFHIDTCQRTIWVTQQDKIEHFPQTGAEIFQGQQAYQFLLRVACGLESRVIGETDIFGQLKEAWKKYSKSRNRLSTQLLPWIQRIFEDTKEIRSLY